MDGMDGANGDLFLPVGRNAWNHDVARRALSGSRARRRIAYPTTRGDRLFISLIAAAVIHLLWIAFAGTDPVATLPIGEGVEVSSLWIASVISLGMAVVIFRNV